MPILKAHCPGCGAGLKCTDPAGFAPGEEIDCPKCGAHFAVAAPAKPAVARPVKARPVEDDRPRKKLRPRPIDEDEEEEDDRPPRRKRRDDDEETGWQRYKRSPVRFVILGVLVVVMLVLAFFLYRKIQRERQDQESGAAPVVVRAA